MRLIYMPSERLDPLRYAHIVPLVMLALPRDARAMKLRIATVDDYWSLQKKKYLFLLFLRVKKMRIAAVDNYRKGKIYAFDK